MINKIKALPKWLLALVLLLVVVRLFLPSLCLHLINKGLSEKLGMYTGHVQDFDLTLYRGAYQLQGLEIKKRDSDLPPLLSIQEIDLSVAWRALWQGEISGDIGIEKATVQITDGNEQNEKQNGTEEGKGHWQDVFELLIPISIESLQIGDSAIYFTNRDLQEPLPVKLEQIKFEAKDIRTKAKNASSPFQLKAKLQDHAELWAQGRANALAVIPAVDLDFSLTKFQPQTLNKILRIYIPLDITSGNLDVFGEMATRQGKAKGYVRVFFADGDIVAPKQKYLSAKHFFIEIASAFSNWLLKSNKTKKVAVEIPFEYDGKKMNVESSDAFWSAVKNSYEQLKPELKKSINFESVPQ